MIGLVTVLFKSDSVLEGFFKSLAEQTFQDYHLYLVDNSANAATNELIEKLTSTYAIQSFTHIKNEANIGVAAGNNVGITLALTAGCSHVLLLNNDIEYNQPDLLHRLVTSGSDPKHPIVVPKILFYGTTKIWMAGGFYMWYKAATIHRGEGSEDSKDFDKPGYFNYAPTCFMLIAKEVFNAVGLMDERYFVYYDDTDFVFRANKLGYQVYYQPDLQIFHKVSTSTGGGDSPFTIYYLIRNRIFFIRKNLQAWQKPIAYLYTLATRVYWCMQYDSRQRNMLLKGFFDGFKM